MGISGDGGPTSRSARRAARRRARWDDDPAPRDWRFFVSSVGKVLMTVGLLMFGFVAYQLWGTGVEYTQAQNDLDRQFEELLAAAPTPATPVPVTSAVASTVDATVTPTTAVAPASTAPVPTTAPTTTTTTTTTQAPAPITVPVPALNAGDALARIEIPAVGVDSKVVAGVSASDLKKGPGHYPGTPMPGQLGNSAVAGHRTTYGEPFRRLDDLRLGDEIVLTTVQGRFLYRVTGSEVVAPSQSQVVQTTDPTRATLTLTTCDPEFTATNRLIVYADLDTATSGEGLPPVLTYGGDPATAPTLATLPGEPITVATSPPATTAAPSSAPPPTTTTTTTSEVAASAAVITAPVTTAPAAPATLVPAEAPGGSGDAPPSSDSADAFSQGWFGDDGAFPQVALWGLLLTAVSVGAYLLSRATRRNWVGALAGIVPFLVVLYFFFQNVNRLLPAAI